MIARATPGGELLMPPFDVGTEYHQVARALRLGRAYDVRVLQTLSSFICVVNPVADRMGNFFLLSGSALRSASSNAITGGKDTIAAATSYRGGVMYDFSLERPVSPLAGGCPITG